MPDRIPTITKYINELTPHPDNYNSHPQGQIAQLAESLTTFGQFKNIVAWTCPANMTTPDGVELHEGLCYILAGHGLWLAAMEAGFDELEVKDYSGLSYEMALTLLMVDNAAPLGSEPIPEKLAALMERTKAMVADRPGLNEMLNRLKERVADGMLKGWDGTPANDPNAEWQGMPEFENEEVFGAIATVKVHFETDEALSKFAQFVGQTVNTETKWIWYPKKEKLDLINYRAIDES